ncbi:glycosyltransferase family 1 protein [Thermus scotoductus]|uniref:Glycosyltransferase family 1 protein n=1 Tax=Thermus scotoductus TaxID=37636 RepID=A0A430SDT7_THESC|nr:glycosyltransferase family 4 protein [Thermus scotoductus]RTG94659.1 glycosyltransferase family 1 protein [Thermus scotoductus]RTH06482.1 glycosyltransferase family 1 protein [Thermus scotoductus]RTH07923.1 glycosyltransferase family 1 protein [Thermus scotoductus]RTH09328.1 glycosyltransferase family 1 protein [Thermus scotoductus]RTH16625.1 glycosyltransferase family 1 protein [Thermus scotoductus]
MRLLYLITRAEPGGAQVHLLELLRGFKDRAELHLGVGEDRDGFLIEEARALGVQVHILKHLLHPIRPHEDLLGLFEVASLLKRVNPHLLHAHSSKAGFLGRVAARALGIRSLFTAHGWAFTEGVSVGRKALAVTLEALAGRLGDGIIAVSEWDRNLALRYRVAAPNRIFTVWNGVPDTSHRADPAREPPRIAMVARFAPQKDHALLLTALASLRELPWTLDLVGDGPLLPEVQALAKRLGLAERVRFWGRRLDVDRLLAEVQVFVLTSNWEGLPLVVLEAMRAGLPVVATDVGGVGEAVVEGKTGFLVGRKDEAGLRERLCLLLENPALRASMGEAGRRRYEEAFTLERMFLETWRVYEEVLG